METNYDGTRPSPRQVKVQTIVDICIWLSVSLLVLFLFLQGKPYDKGFFCDDTRLGYPYRPDTISTPVLLAAGFATSILVVVFIELLSCFDRKCRQPCQCSGDSMYCVKSYGVFLLGFSIQQLLIVTVKNKMSVLRPNYFDVCKPQFNRTLCPSYISDYTCTGTEDDVRNSRQSFPSGHAAFSMYIAMYFCIYIQQRLHISFSHISKFCLQSCLIFMALLCGLGRIVDNKHHPSDVIAGFGLGMFSAVSLVMKIAITVAALSMGTKGTNQLVGKRLLTSSSITCSSQIPLQTTCAPHACCAYERAPSLLLSNEYFNANGNEQETFSSKMITIQNNNIRNLPESMTATYQSEDV